jgi:hypothetical protein
VISRLGNPSGGIQLITGEKLLPTAARLLLSSPRFLTPRTRPPPRWSASDDRILDPLAPLSIVAGGKILRIRRSLVAVLALALGLTGIFLVTITDRAASMPRQNTTVIAPQPAAGEDGSQPGGMGYDTPVPGGMGYDTIPPGAAPGR